MMTLIFLVLNDFFHIICILIIITQVNNISLEMKLVRDNAEEC